VDTAACVFSTSSFVFESYDSCRCCHRHFLSLSDYNGWPGRDEQELPVDHLTEEHRRLIIEKCSNPEENPNPAMPDLPLVPNNTNDSHVRSKRRRLSNGEAIMCSNTLRSISGDAGIRDMEMVLQFTDNTELRFQNISTNITEYARTMANHLNVNYIEAAPATSLIKSILQNNEKTIDERVEELYELSRQLPYWNSHIVTSNITIILIFVRRSPYLIYIIYWQILQCCILIQYLLSIGFIPMQHQIERTVLFSNCGKSK
jgi:hypothetical protein